MVDLQKGQIHKVKPLSLTSGVRRYFGGFVGGETVMGRGVSHYLFLVRRPRLCLLSGRKSRAEKRKGGSGCSNISNCGNAIVPHVSYSFRSTKARRQSQARGRDLFESKHRKSGKKQTNGILLKFKCC